MLLAALVCVAVAAVVFVSALRLAKADRDRLDNEAWQMQAALLAEAAVDRAVARLEKKASYEGEVWSVPATELDGVNAAVVRIRVAAVAGKPGRRNVQVEADFPDHPVDRAREARAVEIPLPGWKDDTKPKR